jgi:hypothetical protein
MDRQLLARATEGTDAPTPGYLYVDLAKQATSNPMACQEMANYLINRLQNKQNPNIKWKCCKVIAKLADQVPRNAFRRCLSSHPTNTAALKEALNFRGNQDPVNGDAPNQRVRTAAKEALDAIYAESASSQMQGPMGGNASAGMGMTGIGSNSYGGPVAGGYGGGAGHGASGSGGGGGGGSGGPRHMEGIGSGGYNHNNRQQYQQPNTNLKQAVAEAGSVLVAMVKDPLARNHTQASDVPRQGHSGNLPGYGGPTVRVARVCVCVFVCFVLFIDKWFMDGWTDHCDAVSLSSLLTPLFSFFYYSVRTPSSGSYGTFSTDGRSVDHGVQPWTRSDYPCGGSSSPSSQQSKHQQHH